MVQREGPPGVRRTPGRGLALALAIVVNLAFVAFLVFSVSWQNRVPEAVTAELYAPPVPTPTPRPQPEPKPEPPPPPPPRPEPVKPPPEPPKAVQPDPEIALKAKKEAERKRREEEERQQKAEEERRQKAEQERKEAEAKRQQEEKRAAEQKARVEALRAEADREMRERERVEQLKAQAAREAATRAEAERESQARARAAVESARGKARAEWIDRIRAKIKGNLTIPPDLTGNPEAVFDVVQLPTGEIIDVQLRRSSGVRAYDDAVQRAILKSSPLPQPPRAEDFTRTLTLRFRPFD